VLETKIPLNEEDAKISDGIVPILLYSIRFMVCTPENKGNEDIPVDSNVIVVILSKKF